MGATKSSEFSDHHNQISEKFKALGHPARVAIVEYLLRSESCICGDIVNELPLAQPTVSRHLKELKEAGIIKGNVEGTSICYCLNEETVSELLSYMIGLLKQLQSSNRSC